MSDPRRQLAAEEQAEVDAEAELRGAISELLALFHGVDWGGWPGCGPKCPPDCPGTLTTAGPCLERKTRIDGEDGRA